MAEESEKRFEAIMDKLFRSPPKSSSKNSSTASSSCHASGAEWTRGIKRPYESSLGVIDPKSRVKVADGLHMSSGINAGSVQVVNCRPWDRGDLFRRLATFKSMTWFAKPQAVSALNCARRGWVNIDMDILACESCGARLLFSTPSSWTLQQVEKAALVFSLKLDSGHKLLCPWVDNICDESLAQFPPKPTDVLVEEYKNRCSALLQLSALPVISQSATDCDRDPQLKEFLNVLSDLGIDDSINSGRSLTNEPLSETSASYYQAQKLISLCGWEPHLLPYIVDCKVQKDQAIKDVDRKNPSILTLAGPSLNVMWPVNDPSKEVDDNSQESQKTSSEPNSVALNCKLCGATVGLWPFSSVSRPLEFLRLIGYTDVKRKSAIDYSNDTASGDIFTGYEINGGALGIDAAFAASTPSNDKTSTLNLTIAGGPPPEKQNYRATISLPVIGRNLRFRFSMDSLASKDAAPTGDSNVTDLGSNQIDKPASSMDMTSENRQAVPPGSSKEGELVANTESAEAESVDVVKISDMSQIGGSGTSMEDDTNIGIARAGEGSAAIVLQANKKNAAQGDRATGNTGGHIVLPAINSEVPCDSGRSSGHKPVNEYGAFDPIRQHRLFCPWIASYSNTAPGWKQTLSALQRHKQINFPLPKDALASIEVDDPIASIHKLFSSPLAKRTKYA